MGELLKLMCRKHSSNLTARPWKSWGLEDWFQLTNGDFQGLCLSTVGYTMKAPICLIPIQCILVCIYSHAISYHIIAYCICYIHLYNYSYTYILYYL